MTVTFDSDYLHDLWLLRELGGFSGYGKWTDSFKLESEATA
jgi:hypothetical protein